MQVNIHEAKTQLSHLIQCVLNGEEVIIARNNQPRGAPASTHQTTRQAQARFTTRFGQVYR